MPLKTKPKYTTFIALILFTILLNSCANKRAANYKIAPSLPPNKLQTTEAKVYWDLANGNKNMDWTRLDTTLEFIKNEYDCSDFRLVNLIRIMYEYGDAIPNDYKKKIEDVLFNFRYWMDEPGENSMCYWSENHQILFASAEFLIGQKYPNAVFPNSGLTGSQHMEKSKTRIRDWLLIRWNYGFTEFYSNVYYKEDVGALINLIDYAENEEISKKSQIILDLLFYDVATQSSKNMFISTSGRAYERNRKGGPDYTFGGVTEYYWGNGEAIDAGMMYGLVTSKKYKTPPILTKIAQDSSNVIIKQNNGLDISELKKEGYYGKDMRSLMMQWGMEAFINPSVVRNSLYHIRKYNMFSNEFLKDFRNLDIGIIKSLHLEPLAIKLLNPQYLGSAIQKGNTYTYRTKDYSIYTAQNHQPGDYGSQHHISGMNISNHFAIYHCHPAVEKDVKMHSPNYWVGYGHLPHSVQDKNVNLSIYNIPKKKGTMEKALLDYTHAYFPKEKFDSILLINNYIFGKKGETYCAFVGANTLNFREGTTDDVIQKGKNVFWITEAGSKTQDGSFEAFVQRIKSNKIEFDERKLKLNYISNNNTYELKFDSDFKLNGQIIDTEYLRFDSPYIKSDKKAETYKFIMDDEYLFLDFNNLIREY
ncbi:hypothetical protein ACFSKN_15875 [Mariniflexile gromovii]|uniref:Heparinase II/III-like protein n=1 Tax=Mariniflexile gromovii TaxID=362523 RepID=A0ABS4BYR0_9FLAO|nr:hypothetical protein [Mariniflexile gromovii]MBP0905716.1 hypothetical protein [Mariniflexile gromovii]